MPATPRTRRDIIGSGTGVYGYGSVVRGTIKRSGSDGGSPREIAAAMSSADPVEVNRIGNEVYKKGNFADALRLYDRAIELSPRNVSYMSNRAAALMGLNRIGEAIKGCEEALRFNPNHGRAHQRLASLFIRIGQVEEADKHFRLPGFRLDPSEVQNLQAIDKHLSKCADARGHSNWRTVLKEVDAAILSGANFSPQLVLCRAEALMMLNRLDDARSILSEVPKVEPFPESCSQKRFCGMLCEAYTHFVKSRIDLALGRFESAATASAKAVELDRRNYEVSTLANTVTLVTSARNRGNELYRSERYTEASTAYEEGLRHDPTNSVLYSNRAACWFKLGKWERTIEDCDQALNFQPNYTKALLRRAAANSKLERWGNAVMDYEAVRRELPDDKEIAESLFHAQVALRKSRGDDVSNMRFGGEVEEISSLEQFKAAVSLPGVSVVHFMKASDDQCKEISPFVDALCIRYPFLNFLKVDIDKWTEISREENVKVVPTFKIYKNGNRVKEIICPNREVLDYSVRYYSL
ncbi:PREDICTED: TPR repeat-containing thioredoxin TTL1 [Tarenaya hassleriana]|uniref:TPR repeat-containing thioredoxin TTL1 n=1 Tax=Tarenaya hassleriana TaxID=28532 RepID=UPI00053C76F6|nr:PREDICTED: TPR repeat-containing thioredoxin TTL1 [Tarenaya hassleriana]